MPENKNDVLCSEKNGVFNESLTSETLKNDSEGVKKAPENRKKTGKSKKTAKKTKNSTKGGKSSSKSAPKSAKNTKSEPPKTAEGKAGGKFQPGQSGNPGGRPRKSALLMELGEYAESEIYRMLHNPRTPRGLRVELLKYVHDKAFGKATAMVEAEVNTTGSVAVSFEGALDEWSK